MFLEKMEKQGAVFDYNEVSTHVLLVDNATKQEINKAVTIPLRFINLLFGCAIT